MNMVVVVVVVMDLRRGRVRWGLPTATFL